MIIRPIRQTEIAAVGDLCVRAYVAGGHLDPGDEYADTIRDVTHRSAKALVLVAEQEGELIGTVTICSPGTHYAEICETGELEFRFLAVEPAAWGQGVGQALVTECEKHGRSISATQLVICVIDINMAGHLFYEKLQFERLAKRDWEPRPGVTLHAYRKILSS